MTTQKRWILSDADADTIAQLQQSLKIHPVICKLLVIRGIDTFEKAKAFFRPSLSDLHDPFLMKDMDKAIERIEQAIAAEEKIMIYGDYDVDGTTAVALVYSFFHEFYANIITYIPNRYTEGYGISFEGMDFAFENQVKLIISLDCGIKANDKIAYAKEKGMDFIVCDHHLPGEELPDAVAILDPKRKDCTYPFDELSGCGIGFKLIQAFCIKNKIAIEKAYQQLDLVATSIASDLVQITGENRILAKFGMDKVNENPRAGFKALLNELKIDKKLEISDAHGSEAVELLIENDLNMALEKTKKVQQNNDERKNLDKDITEEAFSMLENTTEYADRKSTVLFQSHWHKGVIGIVASRLIEKFHRPTIVLAASNGKAVGSGRSVPGFDLHDAIETCSEYLVQFGGHKYAAGLTIELDKIDAFSAAFEKIVSERITSEQLIPQIEIDAEIQLDDINEKFYNIVEQMAPFGPGNMRPNFITREVYDTGFSKLLKDNHLKLNILKDGQHPKNGIAFGMGDFFNLLEENETVDICYQLYANVWNNQTKIEFRLKDMKPSA